ncbi:DUF4389 domain-containing protein [Dehalococcoides mccartyi]|nr:DUF4389 domain-containing protein [Dehalococcoides mccartyi]
MNVYPARLSIAYVDGPRSRLTVFFRVFLVIPIYVVMIGIGAAFYSFGSTGVSIIVVAPLLMILFRRKYPRWWFNFNLEMTKFSTRIFAYMALLTDDYPSTEDEQNVQLELDYPDARELNRWLPLVKWLLAIPHYIVLAFLFFVAGLLIVIGWFAIIITGRFPRGFHNYLVAVSRWSLRVQAYAYLLITDEYPPFSLNS